jgi:hypothetical protein
MASAIRKIGLNCIVWLIRTFGRPAQPGWRRSVRSDSMRGR